MTPASSSASSESTLRRIEREVVVRHRGYLRELTIDRVDGGIVIRGRAVCHYGKQIAFHEVKRLLDENVIDNRIVVENTTDASE